ncbi:hypothetical protein GQ37_005625 [Janthinobacterium sp. BJB1]|nr:hypothetical protein GQ37_005625 [Janthinobacterium sp. BJB1]
MSFGAAAFVGEKTTKVRMGESRRLWLAGFIETTLRSHKVAVDGALTRDEFKRIDGEIYFLRGVLDDLSKVVE